MRVRRNVKVAHMPKWTVWVSDEDNMSPVFSAKDFYITIQIYLTTQRNSRSDIVSMLKIISQIIGNFKTK